MRTFLTLVPEQSTALAIYKWCELCWPGLQRRIPVQNYHLTLAFLGDTDDRALQKLSEVIDDFNHEPIQLKLNDVGYRAELGVLWLGSDAVPDSLVALQKKCRLAANRIGARGSARQYQPHITLARKITVPPVAALLEPDFLFTAHSVELWGSVRGSQGAMYSTLAQWQLGAR